MEDKLKQLLKTIKLNESMLSMVFGVVTIVLIGVLVLRAYHDKQPQIAMEGDKTEIAAEKVGDVAVETKDDGQQYPTNLPEKVTVEKGETLWKIAEKNYGSGYNWVDIAKENNLRNAGNITAGQELRLPKVAIKTVEKKAVVAAVTTPTVADKIEGDNYTVVKNDNLWNISVRAYADGYKWVTIAKANELKHPNYIEVGQKLTLPR